MAAVFGWCSADPEADGCAYYRVKVPFEAMQSAGDDVTYRHRIYEQDVTGSGILFGQRIADPEVATYWQEWASRSSPRLVADLDDDLFHVDPSSPAYQVYSRPEVLRTLELGLALADRVTVSTGPLGLALAKYSDDVVPVPNAVPDWLLSHQRPLRDRIVIGWAGSDTHAMDVAWMHPWWAHWAAAPGVEVHVIGGQPAWVPIGEPNVRHTPWVSGVEAYLRTIDFDIAVIPLQRHIFNASKSAIKAMEMAALGIPIVARKIEPYTEAVYHGVTGYLYRSSAEAYGYVNDLVHDAAMRLEMGAAARRYAEKFSITHTLPLWRHAFDL